ncbi:hypothetical protein ACWGIN_11255 [Streptomyces sp. NPDC054861]
MPAPSAAAAQTSAPVPPRGRRRAGSRPSAPTPTATVTVTAPGGSVSGTEGAAGRAGGSGAGAGEGVGAGGGPGESAGDVVRWAAFCCVLVPVVLVVYGTSLGGAAGAALGLVAVTAVCRVLLRRSEHGLRIEAAGNHAWCPPGGRHHRQD